MHNACPNFEVVLVVVNRCTMRVCFWPNMVVVAVENPIYMKNLIYASPVDSEENHWGSSNH
jgi:hypothetical protein